MELNENGECMVQHHIYYKEIDGCDEIVMMEKGEHRALHNRLQNEGKCNIDVDKLAIISMNARNRSKANYNDYLKLHIQSIYFVESIRPNIRLVERIQYNFNTGNVSYLSRFDSIHGVKLLIKEVT